MKCGKIVILALMAGLLLTGCEKHAAESGVAALKESAYTTAISDFQQAIDDEDNAGDAYKGIGMAKWEQEDYQGALDAFQSSIDSGAECDGTMYNLMACCNMQLEDYDAAITYFELAMESDDNSDELNQEIQMNEIVCYERLGDIDTAKEKLADYMEAYPDDESAAKEQEFLETR